SYAKLPLICLIDGETAGVAEIVAACLQDHKRAVIVGERSKGKSCGRAIWIAESERELHLTTAIFLRPSGKKLDRMHIPNKPAEEWGVRPDPGFEVKHTVRERVQLFDNLRQHEILHHPEDRPADKFPDKARDRAVEEVLKRIKEKGDNS